MKKLKKEWPILLILFLPAIYLAFLWADLPEKVPVSWDFQGNVSRYGQKANVPVYFAIFPVTIYVLLSLVPFVDPRKKILQMGAKYFKIKAIISIFMALLSLFFLYLVQNQNLPINPSLIFVGIGLLISFLGNYFKTIKPNYFIGIRTPWTLEDETIWRKVHNAAGLIWFVGGILIVLFSLLINSAYFKNILLAIILLLVLIPVVHSFVLFKRKQQS